MHKQVALLICAGMLAGCQSGTTYPPVSEQLPEVEVKFADARWTGEKIPKGMMCAMRGGDNPTTPPLQITNIPPEANAVIVEFNDISYPPLATGGGHGRIGFWIDPAQSDSSTISLPAVAARSDKIGPQAFVEQKARTSGRYASAGYLPPCSDWKGNTYTADIKVVYKARSEGEPNKLLAEGHIVLGKF
mgnify:CR=1 FL=1